MDKFRNKRYRFMISVLAGILAAVLTSVTPKSSRGLAPLAWWGTLYPEFCFVRQEKVSDLQNHNDTRTGVKVSFWLAKAFDW